MKKLIPLIAVVLVLTAASCKRNLCEGVVCNNLGTCVDGECSCTPGWTGTTCDVHTNPCDTTICYNGGTCNAGVCNCPGHTSGPFCRTQEAPDHIYIHELAVEKFSIVNQSGATWDTTGEPELGIFADIYPVIKRNGTIIYNGSQWRKVDATYNSFYKWVLGDDSIRVDDITNNNYRMELWDYDGGTDTYMDGFTFTPYTDSTGFPGSIQLYDSSAYHINFLFHVRMHHWW